MFKYALENMWLTNRGFLGTGPNSIVQVNKDLQKGPGDKVTFELYGPLTGEGIADDGTMVGNSEALTVRNFTVEIHERGHSVQSNGLMSEKRTSTDIRNQGKFALGIWTANMLENDVLRSLVGCPNDLNPMTGASSPASEAATYIKTVANNGTGNHPRSPTTYRRWCGGQVLSTGVITKVANLAALAAGTEANLLFGTKVIEHVKRLAVNAHPDGSTRVPLIRPIMIDGQPRYVMLIGPLQAKALRADPDWKNSHLYADIRGEKNPIFTGALGMHDGVILHEYDRCPKRVGTGTSSQTNTETGFDYEETVAGNNTWRCQTSEFLGATTATAVRALFLGAQAGVLGWGQMPQWREDLLDNQRKAIIGTDMIYGVSKTQFSTFTQPSTNSMDQEDFGCIVVDTRAQADAA